jgi:hypothetical protein
MREKSTPYGTYRWIIIIITLILTVLYFAQVIMTTPDTIYVYHIRIGVDCVSFAPICIHDLAGKEDVFIHHFFFQNLNCEGVKLYSGSGTCDCKTFIFETQNPSYGEMEICSGKPELLKEIKLDYYQRLVLYMFSSKWK